MVGTVNRHSIKSDLVPPRLSVLEKLVSIVPAAPETEPSPAWKLNRRLSSELRVEIAGRYEAGAETPALCTEYALSKGGLLKLLHEQGVILRRQPLTLDQLAVAAELYAGGKSIAAVAERFGVSYNAVRQAFVRNDIERRPRGGSHR